ncbi:type 2 isopentenyl-diphosphate Delta-isomerase [Brevibacterium sp. SMBL_HHYL_HB1]|uniref:type 2 isopentenyl-diphosphate Delta-isomerase n=1 Tax=Brevibacterium sp. SMBL_HHYL_HB1 TaxID=2777556 RepID=UPI001BA6A6E3|nr:type 2 isopentenyl-diphosphate Delta-isomerase [Brevibacterium sp. SMBL_HHYL_HB1]QUL78912.1 type 2 isopentenyl-diphosphate Delta-isomerase [Brevibacterium sp. SMBL_HHYL_HB1]
MSSETPSPRAARKDDHVRLASAQQTEGPRRSDFDDLEFVHHALSGTSPETVDLSVDLGDWTWSAPFYVNGMTGGTETTARINRDLALAAAETGLPMACGSMSVALDDAEAAKGFTVIREVNPDGFVMGNLGAGRSADDARRAVELLGADALQIHVNPVQETAMPEGTRDFSEWLDGLAEIVAACPVPVIVKEVGFGLSRRTLGQLAEIGVRFADVSGAGGTDFLRIENDRAGAHDFAMLTGFGQSALACLLDAPDEWTGGGAVSAGVLLASGGVRNPYDVVKALACGARAVGVAGTFLQTVLDHGPDGLIDLVCTWQDQTRALLALLGAQRSTDLAHTDLLTRGRLGEFARLRGIDVVALSHRSEALPSSDELSRRNQQ